MDWMRTRQTSWIKQFRPGLYDLHDEDMEGCLSAVRREGEGEAEAAGLGWAGPRAGRARGEPRFGECIPVSRGRVGNETLAQVLHVWSCHQYLRAMELGPKSWFDPKHLKFDRLVVLLSLGSCGIRARSNLYRARDSESRRL